MNILVAIDSFKGSLSSRLAGEAVKEGFLLADPSHIITVASVADGGEGTLDAITGDKGSIKSAEVLSPTLKKINARFGIEGERCVIESAEAIGLTLLSENERDPEKTSTFGLGQLIAAAINMGARDFIIGIGGSSTNDCGIGMLSALGYEFYNAKGERRIHGASALADIAYIKSDKVIKELPKCSFTVACDVDNPLCGERGASHIYAPQKGASHDSVLRMDESMEKFAKLCKDFLPSSDKDLPGAGAAGGLGFAFTCFLGGRLKKGIDVVLSAINIEEKIKACDLVITGEGRLDYQSANGKTPIGIASLAKKHGKRVIAVSGCIGKSAEELNGLGIDAFFPILRSITSLEEAMDIENAYENLKATAYQVARLIHIYT